MRSVSELFSDAWGLFKTHALLLMGVYAIPVIATLLFEIIIAPEMKQPKDPETIAYVLISIAVITVISLIGSLATMLSVMAPEGKTISAAYQQALSYFFPFLVLSVIVGAVVTLGFILLIIPGIIFSIWFFFAPYILLVEGKRGIEAMKASREYVKGRWWAVFGRLLAFMGVFILISIAAAFVGEMFFRTHHTVAAVFPGILNLFVVPFSTAYMYYMYLDLRKLKEQAIPVTTPSATAVPGEEVEETPKAE